MVSGNIGPNWKSLPQRFRSEVAHNSIRKKIDATNKISLWVSKKKTQVGNHKTQLSQFFFYTSIKQDFIGSYKQGEE